jgi:autotransporter-associated beta strand protein
MPSALRQKLNNTASAQRPSLLPKSRRFRQAVLAAGFLTLGLVSQAQAQNVITTYQNNTTDYGAVWDMAGTPYSQGSGTISLFNGGSIINAESLYLASGGGVILGVQGSGVATIQFSSEMILGADTSGDLAYQILSTADLPVLSPMTIQGGVGSSLYIGGKVGYAVGLGTAVGSDLTLGVTNLYVGDNGSGQILVQHATFTTGYAQIGFGAGATANLVLSGAVVELEAGSQWTNTGNLIVGAHPTVAAGDQLLSLTDSTMTVGGDVTVQNRARISLIGATTRLDIAGVLRVSGSSNYFGIPGAVVELSDGATLSAASIQLGSTTPGQAAALNIGFIQAYGAGAPGVIETPTITFHGLESSINMEHTGVFTLASDIDEAAGASGTLRQIGGTSILTGTNTFTGTTLISGGTLQIGNGGTTGTLASTSIVNDAALVFNRSDALTVVGAISGMGSVTQLGAGTTTLAGENAYAGTTLISGGTLQVGSGGTTGTLGSGAVVNNATLALNRSDDISIANDISGTGGLLQQGSGMTTLFGENTFTGDSFVRTGTLKVAANSSIGNVTVDPGALFGGTGTVRGNLVNNGRVGPGFSPGTLLVTGDYTQGTAGVLEIELASATVYDRLIITGTATVNGSIKVIDSGYTGTAGDTFTILTATGGVTGAPTLDAPPAYALLGMTITVNPNDITLGFPAAPVVPPVVPPVVTPVPPVWSGYTPNQNVLIATLNQTFTAGTTPGLINDYTSRATKGEVEAFLNALSPQTYGRWWENLRATNNALVYGAEQHLDTVRAGIQADKSIWMNVTNRQTFMDDNRDQGSARADSTDCTRRCGRAGSPRRMSTWRSTSRSHSPA